jgi:NAD+ kinase
LTAVAVQRIGVVIHPRNDVSGAAAVVHAWGQRHGVEVMARTEDHGRLHPDVTPMNEQQLASCVDGLISLGGDGTMLGALRLVARRPVPVLGVNLGNVGFLAEIDVDDLPAALDRLHDGAYTLEPHAALHVRSATLDTMVFNDVAIARVPGSGPLRATLTVDGARYGYLRCDAVIVATPTGSTAYSYAAGGPVVSPAAIGMLVTPASPMNGISRPILLGGDEQLMLELIDGAGRPALELDGALGGPLEVGDQLLVSLVREAGLVVRLDSAAHHTRNRVELSLRDLPLLPDELSELLPPRERRWARGGYTEKP